MRTEINPFQKTIISCIIIVLLFSNSFVAAQQAITSIVTDNFTSSQVSYSNVKGAGLRNSSGTLFSVWDSIGASFTINYNVPSTGNILRLTQFSTASITSSLITCPAASSIVKIRHATNTDIGDARNHYNSWTKYSSIPANGATSGTFNFIGPEIVNPDDAFLSNNLTSGYDNIFQNSINSPHFGNIERVDFIVPGGLHCSNSTSLLESGVAVIDRGVGDPFKIAAITAIDGNNTPTAFGNLVSVSAANFGPDLLSSAFNYVILINDPKYYSESRPSSPATQNLRGVYISFADMGLAVNQIFYGYALFGPDVTTANPDWTTYPNNSDAGSQLDPVAIMGLYKTPGSTLPLPIGFTATRVDKTARLQFILYNEFIGDHLIIQRSKDGIHFIDLEELNTHLPGSYTFTHNTPAPGINYYRLKMVEKNTAVTYSMVRSVKFDELDAGITIFPNPVVDKLNINFPSSFLQEPVTAEIFTNTGSLVKKLVFKKPADIESISMTSFQPGRYMLRLTNGKDHFLCIQIFAVL